MPVPMPSCDRTPSTPWSTIQIRDRMEEASSSWACLASPFLTQSVRENEDAGRAKRPAARVNPRNIRNFHVDVASIVQEMLCNSLLK